MVSSFRSQGGGTLLLAMVFMVFVLVVDWFFTAVFWFS